MAATCPHGLAPDECLICPYQGVTEVVTRGPATPARRARGALHLTVVVAAIVVIGLVAWAVAGIVFALLHVVELIAVALVAGWGGYRLGYFRGRHQHN